MIGKPDSGMDEFIVTHRHDSAGGTQVEQDRTAIEQNSRNRVTDPGDNNYAKQECKALTHRQILRDFNVRGTPEPSKWERSSLVFPATVQNCAIFRCRADAQRINKNKANL